MAITADLFVSPLATALHAHLPLLDSPCPAPVDHRSWAAHRGCPSDIRWLSSPTRGPDEPPIIGANASIAALQTLQRGGHRYVAFRSRRHPNTLRLLHCLGCPPRERRGGCNCRLALGDDHVSDRAHDRLISGYRALRPFEHHSWPGKGLWLVRAKLWRGGVPAIW
jgi:hypothetical protein